MLDGIWGMAQTEVCVGPALATAAQARALFMGTAGDGWYWVVSQGRGASLNSVTKQKLRFSYFAWQAVGPSGILLS